MKLLFNLSKINLKIILFLLIWFKPFSSVAASTIKTIRNYHDLDLDNYAITLRYIPTHALNQNIISSEGINQRKKDNSPNFLQNLQTRRTVLSETLNQFELQLFAVAEESFQEEVIKNIGSLRSFYALPTVASVTVWQGNLVREFIATVPFSSPTSPIHDFRSRFESWGNPLLVTNNLTQEVERSKFLFFLSNNFQDLRLSDRAKNPSLPAVVPILPQVPYKNIYKGVYDFDITIMNKPEQKYNFIVN